MIIIDGSYGEGGGQILRSAVALSAVTGIGVTIHSIRRNRPQPGLKAQHLTAVRIAADMTHADISGLEPGATELTFRPRGIYGGHHQVDIGTAGSITLLLQCLMPAAMMGKMPVTLDIRGGTDVAWSPPVDYFSHVLLPALESMGFKCSLQVCCRGYYPKGGGRVKTVIQPSSLTGIEFKKKECSVAGISHSSNLPGHVVQHQAESAVEILEQAGYIPSIVTETSRLHSTGSGITLWCGHIGSSALGRKGLPALQVGKTAAWEIVRELDSGAAVDVHLADQLIPYLGLAGGGGFTVREITGHTSTNIWVVEQFLNVKFRIETKMGISRVSL